MGAGLPTDAAGSAAFPKRTLFWGRGWGRRKAAPEGRQAALTQQLIFKSVA